MAIGVGGRAAEIPLDAPDEVREALAEIGRTEDLRFSPSGRRMVLVGFTRGTISVGELEVSDRGKVALLTLELVDGVALEHPHGIDFLDEDTLVVASRGSGLVTVRLTTGALVRSGRRPGLEVPGSVALAPDGAGDVLVCDNAGNTVTRHSVDADGILSPGAVVLRKWLDLPDGLALSRDGRWLAVSNHDSHAVLIFDFAAAHPEADPVAMLRGVRFPHGLRFGGDGTSLFVADAGTPFVHVFACPDDGWRGVHFPAKALRVMDDETFERGHYSRAEGGPKGIDLHPAGDLLAVTAQHLPLAFFDVSGALDEAPDDLHDDARLDYELYVLTDRERLRARAESAEALIDEIRETKAWRLVQPLQRAYAAALRLRRRGG